MYRNNDVSANQLSKNVLDSNNTCLFLLAPHQEGGNCLCNTASLKEYILILKCVTFWWRSPIQIPQSGQHVCNDFWKGQSKSHRESHVVFTYTIIFGKKKLIFTFNTKGCVSLDFHMSRDYLLVIRVDSCRHNQRSIYTFCDLR